jgi:large subunit ribosomal protein L25
MNPMASVKELKASARPKAGKGAARAERRAGRVPAVIYGGNEPPVTVSIADKEARLAIFAGHFLTTVFDIDLDGKKHRVIPRDFALDPLRDTPIHIDFLRLGKGAKIRVSVQLRVWGSELSPGVKRGGTVNIVAHAVELEADPDHIPQFIEVDVSKLEINNSVHLSSIELPSGVVPVLRDDQTLVTVVPPSGYGEEVKAEEGAAPAASTAAPAAGAAAAAPAAGGAKAPAAKAPAAKAPAADKKK